MRRWPMMPVFFLVGAFTAGCGGKDAEPIGEGHAAQQAAKPNDAFYFADLGYQGPRSFVEQGDALVRLGLPGFLVTEGEGHHPNQTVREQGGYLVVRASTTSSWFGIATATGKTRPRDDGDAVFTLNEYEISQPTIARIEADPATKRPRLVLDLPPDSDDPHRRP